MTFDKFKSKKSGVDGDGIMDGFAGRSPVDNSMSKYTVRKDQVTVQEVVACHRIVARDSGWVMDAVNLIVERVVEPRLTPAEILRLHWPEFEWLYTFVLNIVIGLYIEAQQTTRAKEYLEQWEPGKEKLN